MTAVAAPLDAKALRTLVQQPDVDGERLRTLITDGLEGLADPRERVATAATVARTAVDLGDAARDVRNAAALQLAQDRKAVRVWKDTLGITRNLWTRICEDPENQPGNYEDPETVAREHGAESRRWDAIADAARAVRDATATGLMNGAYGAPARNAEIVALTGLTSARVAQLRTSY